MSNFGTNPCEFEEPVNEDLGQCHPAKSSRDCEAPTIPALSVVTYDPDASDGEYFSIVI